MFIPKKLLMENNVLFSDLGNEGNKKVSTK